MVRAKTSIIKNNPLEEPEFAGAPKIMTKPLPQILDDLEGYIARLEEAVGQAQAAAKDSKETAAQAKTAG